MKIISIGGLTIDWDDDTQTGDYNAWFDSMPMPPNTTAVLPQREGSYPVGVGAHINPLALPPIHLLFMDDDNAMQDRAFAFRQLDTAHEFISLVVVPDEDDPERYYYWHIAVQSIDEEPDALGVGRHVVISAVVVGDPLLTSVDSDTDFQSILNTEEVSTVTQFAVFGDADTYPVITVNAPTVADGWTSRRFVNIRWMSPNAATRYPIELTNGGWNTTSISSHKIGVIVDGVHNEYWFGEETGAGGGFNSTTTLIWSNIDFAPAVSAVVGSYDSTNGILTLAEGYSVEDFPAQGILQYTDDTPRLMTYTGRDFYNNALTGISLGAFGSTSATPVAGFTVYWIQHEVWIVNGTAPTSPYNTPTTTLKPVIDPTYSTNSRWIWNYTPDVDACFGSRTEKNRPASWNPTERNSGETKYIRYFWDIYNAESPKPDDYKVMGLRWIGGDYWAGLPDRDPNTFARWEIYLPCTIDEIAVTGESNLSGDAIMRCYASPNGKEWDLVFNAATDVIDTPYSTFNGSGTPDLSGNHYVRFEMILTATSMLAQIDSARVDFDTSTTPVVTMLNAQNNLSLEMSINSSFFDETLYIDLLPGLREDVESLVIDAANFTAVIMPGGRNAYQAIRRDAPRGWLFRLHPGDNDDLTFTTTYPTDSSVTMTWYDRRYM